MFMTPLEKNPRLLGYLFNILLHFWWYLGDFVFLLSPVRNIFRHGKFRHYLLIVKQSRAKTKSSLFQIQSADYILRRSTLAGVAGSLK